MTRRFYVIITDILFLFNIFIDKNIDLSEAKRMKFKQQKQRIKLYKNFKFNSVLKMIFLFSISRCSVCVFTAFISDVENHVNYGNIYISFDDNNAIET